jgi:hypothetical protein
MLIVVSKRPEVKAFSRDLTCIQALAKSCSKQITAWSKSIEGSPVQGKRHLTPQNKEQRDIARKAAEFRKNFLKNLQPTHPLYNTPEAQAARGEAPPA